MISCVAKRDSGSNTGKVILRRSDRNWRTTGAGGALYTVIATEAPAEVPTGDDAACVADRAR